MSGMNHRGDNLEEIYAWIDEVQFSRPKKNLPRDFSDGVLMAEVLKVHCPGYVDVHNYIPANNVAAKKENWKTLNRKVFSKIDMKLSKEMVDRLANAQPGVIEKVLMDLRSKISIKGALNSGENGSVKIEYEENFDKHKTENGPTSDTNIRDEKVDEGNTCNDATIVKVSRSEVSVAKVDGNFIGKACGWIAGWMWPFSKSSETAGNKKLSSSSISAADAQSIEVNDPKITEKSSLSIEIVDENHENDEESTISRTDFLQLRKQVEEKNAAIHMLNRKVSCLESLMKLKDKKIGNLSARISSTSEAAQNLRPHVMGSSISRLRSPVAHARSKHYNQ